MEKTQGILQPQGVLRQKLDNKKRLIRGGLISVDKVSKLIIEIRRLRVYTYTVEPESNLET